VVRWCGEITEEKDVRARKTGNNNDIPLLHPTFNLNSDLTYSLFRNNPPRVIPRILPFTPPFRLPASPALTFVVRPSPSGHTAGAREYAGTNELSIKSLRTASGSIHSARFVALLVVDAGSLRFSGAGRRRLIFVSV
jgi:hypothetical protein